MNGRRVGAESGVCRARAPRHPDLVEKPRPTAARMHRSENVDSLKYPSAYSKGVDGEGMQIEQDPVVLITVPWCASHESKAVRVGSYTYEQHKPAGT